MITCSYRIVFEQFDVEQKTLSINNFVGVGNGRFHACQIFSGIFWDYLISITVLVQYFLSFKQIHLHSFGSFVLVVQFP